MSGPRQTRTRLRVCAESGPTGVQSGLAVGRERSSDRLIDREIDREKEKEREREGGGGGGRRERERREAEREEGEGYQRRSQGRGAIAD